MGSVWSTTPVEIKLSVEGLDHRGTEQLLELFRSRFPVGLEGGAIVKTLLSEGMTFVAWYGGRHFLRTLHEELHRKRDGIILMVDATRGDPTDLYRAVEDIQYIRNEDSKRPLLVLVRTLPDHVVFAHEEIKQRLMKAQTLQDTETFVQIYEDGTAEDMLAGIHWLGGTVLEIKGFKQTKWHTSNISLAGIWNKLISYIL